MQVFTYDEVATILFSLEEVFSCAIIEANQLKADRVKEILVKHFGYDRDNLNRIQNDKTR